MLIKKKQEKTRKKRQQIAVALGKFNNAREKEMKFVNSLWNREDVLTVKDIIRNAKSTGKIIDKYGKFWAKNGEFIERYLYKPIKFIKIFDENDDIEVFPDGLSAKNNNTKEPMGACLKEFEDSPLGAQENIGFPEFEDDSFEWFNLEDVKNANDLRQCWNFIREWKTYFSNYRKLRWGEKSGRRAIYENMWSEIRDYYYKLLKQNEKIDKAKRYEIIAGEFNKKYKPLFPGKRSPVPQEDAFWRKFYSIKDKHSKRPTAIKIK